MGTAENFLSAPETWLMIGGPFIVLAIVGVIMAAMYRRRVRAQREALAAAEQDQTPVEPSTLAEEEEPAEPGSWAEAAAKIEGDQGWRERLRQGLAKTRDGMSSSFKRLFSGKTAINDELMERIHEVLYKADVGVQTSDKLIEALKEDLRGQDSVDWPTVAQSLRQQVEAIVGQSSGPMHEPEDEPLVILIVGVNGVGKTTTIGKLAKHFISDGKTVLLAAGDTFRAAASEQLKVWADRLGVECVSHKEGADPAAVAYDAVKAAMARKVDVLLVDTAGRLHSKKELMAELEKVNRVLGKDLPGAPHETWIVVDATTGQNAAMQVKAFREVCEVTGIVVTKLDGTAKGGVVVGIADQQNIPIRFVGVGEKAEDLRPFSAQEFAEALFES